jgi:DNA-binding response OmpR family regulator
MARIPALPPDVAILDVRLPDGEGSELGRADGSGGAR